MKRKNDALGAPRDFLRVELTVSDASVQFAESMAAERPKCDDTKMLLHVTRTMRAFPRIINQNKSNVEKQAIQRGMAAWKTDKG